jgi:tRNA-splicing ligase RtcB
LDYFLTTNIFLRVKVLYDNVSIFSGGNMQVINNIPVWGEPDMEAVNQLTEAMKYDGVYGCLMADHHIGYSVPIGGVIAYENRICVNGVGYDIACGNKAVRLDSDAYNVKQDIYRIMNEIQKHISFGVGRKNNEIVEHPLFDDPLWSELEFLSLLKDKAHSQLGTVGSGNHYVDVFIDESGRVWVGVHFGSRGLGHTIATHFIKQSGGKDGIHATPIILHENSDLGEQYIKCMELAGKYAYAGRDWVCSRVAKILKGNILEEIHNHHNFAWRENHHGKDLWVVRKGATPNKPGVRSFVGGSMGDYSFILEGVESASSKTSLYSTIHGAGRTMGRTQARGKRNRKTGAIISQGLISKSDMDNWIDKFCVELRGADVDEAPQAYKRIEHVLSAHQDTVSVIHHLKPIGVCMADDRVHDPYKD